jgi:phospholipid-binding lipoprotein MlaA
LRPNAVIRFHLVSLVLIAAAVSGCGTISRLLDSASAEAPAVVVPSALADGGFDVDPAIADRLALETGSAIDVALGAIAAPIDSDAVASVDTAGVEANGSAGLPVLVAQARGAKPDEDEYDLEEYDPWEPFNEAMFDFNRKLDRYILKPVAKGYDKVVPDEVQRMVSNAFDNLNSFVRLFNSLFQGKWDGAVREFSRFLLNTTVGIGGLFDVARAAEIQKSREDFGQTLGWYGVGPGPFLILPFTEPLTVRDGIGKVVDGFFDPLSYLLPFLWERLFLKVEDVVNDRSLNLELYQGFEETVIDMYSAVRHAYLERRRNLIRE